MGWGFGKGELELPEEYKDMKKDDLVALLKKGKEADGKINDLQTKFTAKETEFNTLKTESDGHKTSLASQKAQLDKLAATVERIKAAGFDVDGAGAENGKGEIPDILEDEDAAIRLRVREELAPTTQLALAAAITAARMQFDTAARSDKNYRLLTKYRQEFEEVIKTQPDQYKAMPTTYFNAFQYIKGLHADDIAEASKKGESLAFSEGVSQSDSQIRMNNESDKPKEELTPQELEIAKKMKVDPKRFLERRQNIKVVNV